MVRNADDLSATIFTRDGTSGSFINRGLVGENSTTSVINRTGLTQDTDHIQQAFASASGKLDSLIREITVRTAATTTTTTTTAAPLLSFNNSNFGTISTNGGLSFTRTAINSGTV